MRFVILTAVVGAFLTAFNAAYAVEMTTKLQLDAITAEDVLGHQLPKVHVFAPAGEAPLSPFKLPNLNKPQPIRVEGDVPKSEPVEPKEKKKEIEWRSAKSPVKKAIKKDGDAPIGELKSITLFYEMDNAQLLMDDRKKLTQLIESVDYKKIRRIHLTSVSSWGPLNGLNLLGFHRTREIKGLLRERGVDTSTTIVSEIYMKTVSKQYVKIDIWYKK